MGPNPAPRALESWQSQVECTSLEKWQARKGLMGSNPILSAMAYLTYCNACCDGDHDNHREVVQAVPEGMVGGAICKCQGECRDGSVQAKLTPVLPNDLLEAIAA